MSLKKVLYYKTINEIKCTDGFIVPAGTIVILNYIENNTLYNVMYEDADSQRFFWILNDNIEFVSEKKENWSKTKLNQYNLNITEKWLEHEHNSSTQGATSLRKIVRRKKKNSTSDSQRRIQRKKPNTGRKKEKNKR